MTEISDKEIEAALSAWNNYSNSGPVAEDRSDAMRAALSAAARVRGGAPISLADAEKAFLDRVWPRLQNGCYRAHNLIPIEIQRLDFNEFVRDGLCAVFEAAARVRAEAAAGGGETLVDVVTEDVWQHD